MQPFPLSVSFWIERARVVAGLGTQYALGDPAHIWTSEAGVLELRPCQGQDLNMPNGLPASELRVSLFLVPTRDQLTKNCPNLADTSVAYFSIGAMQDGGYPAPVHGAAHCGGDLMRSLACNRDAVVSLSVAHREKPIDITPNTVVESTGFQVLVDWKAAGPPARVVAHENRHRRG